MLKISNVETFYGKIQALRGVDLDVNQGEIVSLIGSLFFHVSFRSSIIVFPFCEPSYASLQQLTLFCQWCLMQVSNLNF